MLSEASILVTNHGNHPTEKWAMAAAARIINDLKADNPLAEAKAQIKIAEVLEKHHSAARDDLHSSLKADGKSVLASIEHDVEAVVKDICAAMKDSPWADHFNANWAYLSEVVHQFLTAQVHTDKLWHCDANPDCPHAQVYKAS